MSIYSEQDTALMLAGHKVTGNPFYTGKVVYTFRGGNLRHTRPTSGEPLKHIAKCLSAFQAPTTKPFHLVVEMTNGIIQQKEVEV